MLGACLHALGQIEEAAPLLEPSYLALRETFGDERRRTKDALARWKALNPDSRPTEPHVCAPAR